MTQFKKDISELNQTFRESDSYDELDDRLGASSDLRNSYSSDFDPSYKDQYEIKRNYYGFGPKGYRRSDQKLKDEARLLLNQDPILDSSNINIEVFNNVIYLRGFVDSRKDKKRAELLIEDIFGIEDIQNQLKIMR